MAKKAPSTLINMFLSLTVIAVVASAVLALVSGVTAEPIRLADQKKTEDALKQVLPQFASTQTDTVDQMPLTRVFDNNGSLVGVAVVATSHKGFGGDLRIMFGFTPDGDICGYQVLATSETPGLGAKADGWFQKDGKGSVIGMNPDKNNITVKKDGGEVDAISGSTITSRAFCDAVSIAYNTFKKGGLQQ